MKDVYENITSISSSEELFDILKNIDTEVPQRTAARTTEPVERFCFCRLLSTLARTEYLHYPLTAYKREKPDFLIESSSHKIGVEVVEATSEEHSKSLADQEKDASEDSLIGDTRVGSAIKEEVAGYIVDALKKKRDKSKSYEHFAFNWLHVYVNQPYPFLRKNEMLERLKLLSDDKDNFDFFDTVFLHIVLTNKGGYQKGVLVVLEHKGFSCLFIKDLWRNKTQQS